MALVCPNAISKPQPPWPLYLAKQLYNSNRNDEQVNVRKKIDVSRVGVDTLLYTRCQRNGAQR